MELYRMNCLCLVSKTCCDPSTNQIENKMHSTGRRHVS